jgi:hypothetical protein
MIDYSIRKSLVKRLGLLAMKSLSGEDISELLDVGLDVSWMDWNCFFLAICDTSLCCRVTV